MEVVEVHCMDHLQEPLGVGESSSSLENIVGPWLVLVSSLPSTLLLVLRVG